VDLFGQRVDLRHERGERAERGASDMRGGDAGISGRAAGSGGQPGVHDLRRGVTAVADAGQEPREPAYRQPVGAVLAVEAGQEAEAHRAVELVEQPDRAGRELAQMCA